MIITVRLKGWLEENYRVAKGSDDGAYRKAAASAIADGSLSVAVFESLSKSADDDSEKSADDSKVFRDILVSLKALRDAVVSDGGTPEPSKSKASKPSDLEKMVLKMGHFGSTSDDGEPEFSVRVKGAAEQYSDTKSAVVFPEQNIKGKRHPMAGQPVKDFSDGGRVINNASDLDKAVAGAFSKFLIASGQRGGSKTFGFASLPEHDKSLLCYALERMEWGGSTDGRDYSDIKGRKLTPNEQKALIDDATSGGIEAAPIVFDDMVIQTPLLHGELYPLVNTVPLDRGRRVEGVSTGTVTGGWGGVDDTAVSLFNTASYVTAFDTTIFRWEGAINIGLDFMSDSPIDFGQHVTSQYGERLLEDLDDVIATGNGTTQPEGIMNKAGTTSIAFGGSTSLGNYESLRFGVAKNEHRSNLMSSAVFCGTETSYQRARAIPVGASDARRLGGMDYSSYMWMERPYKINESLAENQIFYAILARYRMYRRRGLTIRTTSEGSTLVRANEMLVMATARFGGQLERGAAAAVTTTAPA